MIEAETLVLGGGAALYPGHIGAVAELWSHGWRPKRGAGISAGAIVLAGLADGHKPDELLDLAAQLLPKKVIGWNLMPWSGWSLWRLDRLEDVLREWVPATFSKAEFDLHIGVFNTTERRCTFFSSGTTPGVSVPWAARVSASMPGVFPAERYRGDYLADGGTTNNYPIDYLHGSAIGFRLLSEGEDRAKPVRGPVSFALSCYQGMREAIEREHIEDAEAWARTITLRMPWKALDFWGLTQDTIRFLYDAGREQTRAALEKGAGRGYYRG